MSVLDPAAALAVASAVFLLMLYFAFRVQDWRGERARKRRRSH